MCGVAGLLYLDGRAAEPRLLQRMGEAIAHRGPDGEGTFCEGPLGLSHRRLAIIDLSPAGHQPMMSADGNFLIAYNGEVYNHVELRVELEALGHRFRSRTDTEVVLAAFIQWGADALLRFNGMFAFAIWDRRRKQLLLARDRYGIKPLYWRRDDRSIIFGSEIKAILAHPDVVAQVNVPALREYMTFQNFFTDQTLFAGIHLLPAGTFVVVDESGRATERRYWDYNFCEPVEPRSADAYREELVHLFEQAVSRQLISDVPLGTYLSGGMDSGSITAVAARQLPNLQTFTVGFDMQSASGLEAGCDERRASEYMSYLFKTEHYEMVLKAGDMERCMRQLVWHLEEPRVGQSYPNFYAAKLASKFGKVVLGGAGGDELFGGYPWRYYRAAVNSDFENYTDKYYAFWQRLIPNDLQAKVFSPVWDQVGHVDTREIFRGVLKGNTAPVVSPEDYINRSLYLEAKTFLHGLLVVDDKLSMAHSLEGRVPFLDNHLVDFAMQTPVRLKLGNLGEVIKLNENDPGIKISMFFNKTRDGKLILREAMKSFIPDDVAGAIKQGFSAPDASWFRGESIDYVQRLLAKKSARIYDFFDHATVNHLLNEHTTGKENRRLLIWSLLYLEVFLDTFLAHPQAGA